MGLMDYTFHFYGVLLVLITGILGHREDHPRVIYHLLSGIRLSGMVFQVPRMVTEARKIVNLLWALP